MSVKKDFYVFLDKNLKILLQFAKNCDIISAMAKFITEMRYLKNDAFLRKSNGAAVHSKGGKL